MKILHKKGIFIDFLPYLSSFLPYLSQSSFPMSKKFTFESAKSILIFNILILYF